LGAKTIATILSYRGGKRFLTRRGEGRKATKACRRGDTGFVVSEFWSKGARRIKNAHQHERGSENTAWK